MKLMTKEIEKKFEKFPIYSQDGKGENSEVVVKYFTPFGGATWLITEGAKTENGDWELYGYCTLGCEWEWGYVMLSQLQTVSFLERDLHCEGMTVKELI